MEIRLISSTDWFTRRDNSGLGSDHINRYTYFDNSIHN